MAELIDRAELRERIYSRFGRYSTKVIATVEEGRVMSDWAFLEPFLNAAPAVNRWIPCEKQMPEPEENVWICYFGSDLIMPDYKNGETPEECMARIEKVPTVTIGFIGSDGWYGIDGYPLIISPSFWMPLFKPEPPERKEENR